MKKTIIFIYPFVFCLFFSCSKDSFYWDLPRVEKAENTGAITENWQLETLPITRISSNTANGGANFISTGTENVTSKGLCYAEQTSPTINDSIVKAGSGISNFTGQIYNLKANTTYFVRSFAHIDTIILYGNEQTFTTLAYPATLINTNNCSDLTNFVTNYQGMNNSNGPWGISDSGHSGSCLIAPDPNKSGNLGTAIGTHYIEFDKNFSREGFLELWLNTEKAGSDNLIPQISVDGYAQPSAEVIGGSASSFEWVKIRTAKISSGQHTIRIQFNGSYYVFKIDEIEQYEY